MSRSEKISFKDQATQRLDLFLSETYPDNTRSYWNKMIQYDLVQVNNTSVKSGYKLKKGDAITIDFPEVDTQYAHSVKTIQETDSIIVINKPAGMLTHSKGQFNPEFTVADYIAPKVTFAVDGENKRAGIVHRLDRQTSGVLIAAKTQEAAEHLQAQFAERKVQKYYLGVVQGLPKEDQYDIVGSIGRSTSNPKKMTILETGKEARTQLFVVARDTDLNQSIILFKPITGRTHQLRVHASSIGFPLVGDSLYQGESNGDTGRFLLHAYCLRLTLESGGPTKEFIADLPDDMSSYIDNERLQTVSGLIQ